MKTTIPYLLYLTWAIVFLILSSTLSLVLYRKRNCFRKPQPQALDKTFDPSYDVLLIPNFLSHQECDQIIQLSQNNLFPSKVYGGTDDNLSENTRKSEQCWLPDSTHHCIQNLSNRVKDITNTHSNNAEHLQVVKYSTGGFFSPHYDACDGNSQFCERMDGTLGPRLYTFLIYLNDDYEGGETVFPKINKTVKPKKGTAILFKNVDHNGNIIEQAFHGGNPVSSGEKWIANKWIRLN